MAGEIKKVYGSQKTLSTSIAGIANNAISAAIGTYSSSDTNDYPDAEFVLKVAFGTAPTRAMTLELFVRPLNVVGTNDTVVPTASYQPHRVCSFVVENTTSTQYLYAVGYDLPKEGEFYLLNNGTGQTTSANAELYMTPRSYAPT